jgi:hypothetical protein
VGGGRSAIDVPTPCGEVRGLTRRCRGRAKKRGPTLPATCRRDPQRQYVRHHHHRDTSLSITQRGPFQVVGFLVSVPNKIQSGGNHGHCGHSPMPTVRSGNPFSNVSFYEGSFVNPLCFNSLPCKPVMPPFEAAASVSRAGRQLYLDADVAAVTLTKGLQVRQLGACNPVYKSACVICRSILYTSCSLKSLRLADTPRARSGCLELRAHCSV